MSFGRTSPLPRELGRSGNVFLILLAYFVLATTGILVFSTLERFFERRDHTRQIGLADL